MHDHEPCGVDSCPALAADDRGFCVVHAGARRAKYVLGGTRCLRCHRLIDRDEYVTEDSTVGSMTHAVCPPRRALVERKKARAKPLLETAGEPDAG